MALGSPAVHHCARAEAGLRHSASTKETVTTEKCPSQSLRNKVDSPDQLCAGPSQFRQSRRRNPDPDPGRPGVPEPRPPSGPRPSVTCPAFARPRAFEDGPGTTVAARRERAAVGTAGDQLTPAPRVSVPDENNKPPSLPPAHGVYVRCYYCHCYCYCVRTAVYPLPCFRRSFRDPFPVRPRQSSSASPCRSLSVYSPCQSPFIGSAP